MVRLRSLALRPGDLLLIQGPPEATSEFAADNGQALAERELRILTGARPILAIRSCSPRRGRAGLLPAAVAFLGGVLASMALRTCSPRTVYEAVDWPVIVLLGALLAARGRGHGAHRRRAPDRPGTARYPAQGNAVVGLVVILVTTMTLSDLMNNAATVASWRPL